MAGRPGPPPRCQPPLVPVSAPGPTNLPFLYFLGLPDSFLGLPRPVQITKGQRQQQSYQAQRRAGYTRSQSGLEQGETSTPSQCCAPPYFPSGTPSLGEWQGHALKFLTDSQREDAWNSSISLCWWAGTSPSLAHLILNRSFPWPEAPCVVFPQLFVKARVWGAQGIPDSISRCRK